MPNLPSKRVAAIAAVALVVAGGGAAALAATSSSGSPDFLDSVAKHLGVSRQKLDDATKAAAIDQVDAQLAAGKITKAQADEAKKRIEAGDVPPLGGGRGPGLGLHPGGPGFGPPGLGLLKAGIGDSLTAAAKYLGLSEAELRSELGDGQSLADVAKARGKDLDGLKQAILDAAKAALGKAVADKDLTQTQADDALAALKDHVDDIVNAKPGDRPRLRDRGRGPAVPGWFGP
jgi:hypothetical protein